MKDKMIFVAYGQNVGLRGRLYKQLAPGSDVFMLNFINKNENALSGFPGNLCNSLGDLVTDCLFLFLAQFAGYTDVNIRHSKSSCLKPSIQGGFRIFLCLNLANHLQDISALKRGI